MHSKVNTAVKKAFRNSVTAPTVSGSSYQSMARIIVFRRIQE